MDSIGLKKIFCNLAESSRKQSGIKGYYKLRKAELTQKSAGFNTGVINIQKHNKISEHQRNS